MRTLVVYESMFGNTRHVLRRSPEVSSPREP